MSAGGLSTRVVFDSPIETPDGYGGFDHGWSVPPASYACWAAISFVQGTEAIADARLADPGKYRVTLRASTQSRAITTAWRMRNAATGQTFAITSIDIISSRRWVWLRVMAEADT